YVLFQFFTVYYKINNFNITLNDDIPISNKIIEYENKCKKTDYQNGFLEFKKLAVEKKCQTYYPNGAFEGFLVPHEETITIAKSRSEEHTSELQTRFDIVCRLLLVK